MLTLSELQQRFDDLLDVEPQGVFVIEHVWQGDASYYWGFGAWGAIEHCEHFGSRLEAQLALEALKTMFGSLPNCEVVGL